MLRSSRRLTLWTGLLLACGGPPPQVELDTLAQACQEPAAARASFDLATATNFDWERVYVFGPYTPMESIESSLGFAWAPATTSGLAERDDVSMLVFVHEGEVAHWLLHPRAAGDFSEIVAPGGIAREAARFGVRRLDLDAPRCLVLPIEHPID